MNNIIEKTENLLADTITPVSAYLKIRDVFPNSLLLESTDFHHVENCHSFICMNPISEFLVENGEIVVHCREEPIKGKVNKELIKEFSRFFRKRVELVSGFTSKQKVLLIRDVDRNDVEKCLFSD